MKHKFVNLRTWKEIYVDDVKLRMKRLRIKVFGWAKLMEVMQEIDDIDYVFQGLTYREDEEWEGGHIREYIRQIRKVVDFRGVYGYIWVAEKQLRGAVHYHCLFAIKPKIFLPFPDKEGLWIHGSSHVSKRAHMKKHAFYLCKYIGKGKVYEFPKGLRVCGSWINPKLVDEKRRWLYRLSTYPQWLQDLVIATGNVGLMPKRAEGGGWIIDKECDVVVYSDWYCRTS